MTLIIVDENEPGDSPILYPPLNRNITMPTSLSDRTWARDQNTKIRTRIVLEPGPLSSCASQVYHSYYAALGGGNETQRPILLPLPPNTNNQPQAECFYRLYNFHLQQLHQQRKSNYSNEDPVEIGQCLSDSDSAYGSLPASPSDITPTNETRRSIFGRLNRGKQRDSESR